MFFKNLIHWVILFTVLHLLLIQCKEEGITDDTYFDSKVIILDHRGMGVQYKMPHNTWESIDPAIGLGVDGAEVDVQISKDTVLILFHDQQLNPMTTCTGTIFESTWDDLKECEYYSVKKNVFLNKADDVFGMIPNLHELYFSFDFKIYVSEADYDLYVRQKLRAIKRLCEKYDMTKNVFIEASEDILITAQELGIQNKLFVTGDLTEATIVSAVYHNFFGITCSFEKMVVDANQAHEKGLYVMAYSPNNYYQNKDLLREKVDIIQTDDPISILKLLERYNYDYVIP